MFSEINGASIHWEEKGSGDKRVLLLHGWGCSIELMQPVADRLPECRTLLVDFPAHGQSGKPPCDWGVPDFAAALLGLLRERDFLPCTVIGHSFGCRVAIWLAAQEPTAFDRLILTGAAGIRKPPTPESEARTAAYKRGKEAAAKLRRIPLLGKAADSVEDRLRHKYGSADYNALDADLRGTFSRVVSQDLSDCLPKIKQPTILLFGTADTETPLWMGEKMAELIPDAALIRLEGGTHFAYLEQLDRFTAIARSFLQI